MRQVNKKCFVRVEVSIFKGPHVKFQIHRRDVAAIMKKFILLLLGKSRLGSLCH